MQNRLNDIFPARIHEQKCATLKQQRDRHQARQIKLSRMIDHMWPGSDDQMAEKAAAGDMRAGRCIEALKQVFREILDEPRKCEGCHAELQEFHDIGACSIAHFNANESVAIPLCCKCASSLESTICHALMVAFGIISTGRSTARH